MPEDREWSWVGEDGVVHGLSEDELTFALSSEEIPAYTLVSHQTWSEWLPAMQVAELVWALPSGHADSPRKAELLERGGRREAPDLARYPALRERFDDIRLGRVDPKAESPSGKGPSLARATDELDLGSVVDAELDAVLDNIDALASAAPAAAEDEEEGAERPASDVAANLRVSARPRDPPRPVVPSSPRGKLPSFDEAPVSAPRGKLPSSSALGPPLAPRRKLASDAALGRSPFPPSVEGRSPTPPPPRAVSSPELPPLGSRPPPPRLPAPSSPDLSALAALNSSSSAAMGPSTPAPGPASPVPPVASAALGPGGGIDGPRASVPGPAVPFAVTPPLASPESPRFEAAVRPSLADAKLAPDRDEFELRRPGKGKWVLAGLVVAGLVGAGGFALHLHGADPAPVAPTASAAPPPPPPKRLVSRCRSELQPTRVFDFAKPEVKPVWGGPLDGGRVPLGFGQTSRLALGVTVNPANLASSVVDRQDEASPMLSVVPFVRDGVLQFLVERAASRLQTARAVPAKEPFSIGLRGKTIAARLGKPDHDLWPSPWETLSVPEVARIDAKSHAVAIRGGGQRGAILVGKVGENGQPMGELEKLEVPVAKVGEPSLAVSQGRVWLATDGGATHALGQLFVGSKPVPGVPTRAELVADAGDTAAAPSALGLPQGDVFVQWTSGPVGKQSVVGRVFTSELKARGELISLSPPGADAHHGVTTLVGERLLTVYFVRLPTNNHELWAAAVSCTVVEE